MNISKAILGTGLVVMLGVAGGLIGSTFIAAGAYTKRGELTQRKEQTLRVTGSARKRIRSDRAIWRVVIMGKNANLQEAYRILQAGVDKVKKFLDTRGFPEVEVKIGSIDTTTYYIKDEKGRDTRKVDEYHLSRGFTITSTRLEEISSASAEVTELLSEGVLVVSSAPDFIYTKIADLKVEIIGEASKDARARAEKIVTNAGCRLGEVRSARMGVLQITRPDSTEVSDYGIYDTSTIEKDATAVVGLTITIESN